jgi:CYTH domain-containing protein
MRTPVIAKTGGACGGKTTSINVTRQKMADRGWHGIIIPEAATEFRSHGLMVGKDIPVDLFQEHLLEYIIERENRYKLAAEACHHPKKFILCDRGRMDAKAYMTPEGFEEMVKRRGYTIPFLRDEPYDAVLHLQSVAVDKPEFYTCDNNPARTETLEEAAALDPRTKNAWLGHPHFKVIDNSTNLEGKVNRVIQHLCRILGIPVPLEIERKYLVEMPSLADIRVPYQVIDITQHYLETNEEGAEERVRARGQDGAFLYFKTVKRTVKSGVRMEIEEQINLDEYVRALRHQDPNTRPIRKERVCFLYDNQYFELDMFRDFNLCLLEIELTEENEFVSLPPFVDIKKEVTGEKAYSNASLARLDLAPAH